MTIPTTPLSMTTSGSEILTFMAERASAVAPDFGDGWMSNSARDLMRIALIAGFDPRELGHRLALANPSGRTMNIRTVERVMAEMEVADPQPRDTHA